MLGLRGGVSTVERERARAHQVGGSESIGAGLDLIASGIYDEYSVGPSIRPICTRCCLTMTHMIQVCSNFHSARVLIIKTRPDEIVGVDCGGQPGLRQRLILLEKSFNSKTFWQ